MDKDWASRHLEKPVQYRDRKPDAPPPKPWGKIIGVLLLLGMIAGGALSWKLGLIDPYLPPTPPSVATDGEIAEQPAEPLVASPHPEPIAMAPMAILAPPGGPAQPMVAPEPTLDAKQRESILRGIDVQTRRRQEHESRAAGLEAQIKHATAKLYPPNGSPKVDFDTFLLNQIRSARAAKETSNATTLELQLGDYRRKLQELRTKLAHERDVIASCTKIIDQEKAKLIP